jgi:hypothetical protein
MWICPGIGAACDVAFNHVYRLAFVYLIAVAMTLTIRELFHRSVPAVWALARDEFDAPADDALAPAWLKVPASSPPSRPESSGSRPGQPRNDRGAAMSQPTLN